jgi:hypothetical protein
VKNLNIKFSKRSKELLIKILFNKASLDEIFSCDQRQMAFLAIFSRVESHILWRLRQLFPNPESTPASLTELIGVLQNRCLMNAAINLNHDGIAQEVCAGLKGAGVDVMFLKGTSLRARFPELAGRPQCDTDLMVRFQDLERAEKVMIDLGFRVDEKIFTREEYLEKHFDLRLIREQVPVEVHWAMSNNCFRGAVERSWERAEKVNWRGLEVYFPSVEDEAVFSLVHICRHDFILSLKWFGDFLMSLEANPQLIQRMGLAAQDWPPRAVKGPLWIASRMGMPLEKSETDFRVLDRVIFNNLVRAAVFNEPWLGIPQYRFSEGLNKWVFEESSSLAASLVMGLARGVVHQN